MLGLLPIDIVERALLDKGTDMILILAKAAGCSWTTTKALLAMQTADRGLSKQDVESALKSYELLRRETAQRVVKFYERRFGRHPVVRSRRGVAVGSRASDPRPLSADTWHDYAPTSVAIEAMNQESEH
jgi:hypothetical protein